MESKHSAWKARHFSAPSVVNIELTEGCNHRCRHCYNYWRHSSDKPKSMNKEGFDRIFEQLVDANVFHVVLSGGEPFLNFEVLQHAVSRLKDKNITLSCNSNLTVADEDKVKRLADIGLDHILTSLNTSSPVKASYITNNTNAFEKINKGIEIAVKNGIRVSANMIVSKHNIDDVFPTGQLAADLGCQKFFGTKLVPPSSKENNEMQSQELEKADVIKVLEQMLEVKSHTGIMIGTLVSYPLCLLSDLNRYRDFVGRGCPAQSGHFMSLSADGSVHACVHQPESYGNVFKDDLRVVYDRMKDWHIDKYKYEECVGCMYHYICRSGCRMTVHAQSGNYWGKDPLMTHKNCFTKEIKNIGGKKQNIDQNERFFVPERIRFRKEDGFYLLNTRWANTVLCETELSEKLQNIKNRKEIFFLKDVGIRYHDALYELVECDVLKIAGKNEDLKTKKQGFTTKTGHIIGA